MHVVTPKAFMVAQTRIDYPGMRSALSAMGAPDHWLEDGTDTNNGSHMLTEVAGRLCYKAFGTALNQNLSKVREGNQPYILNLLKQRHGSVLTHSTVTFIFVDVTRILTHEQVRHAVGTAYSHESGRFVRMEDLGFYMPQVVEPEFIEQLAEYAPSFNQTKEAWATNRADSLRQGFYRIVEKFEEWAQTQAELLGLNNPAMPFGLKKKMTSALRRGAPEGRANNIMVTANHRAWRWMIEARSSDGAEEEIAMLFKQVARQLHSAFPNIYQDMVLGTEDAAVTFEYDKV